MTMQHESIYTYSSRAGGRISSSRFRETVEQSGVHQTSDRYHLLMLIKRVGKTLGLTSRMIQLLDYYINYTRDIDWEEGAQPIIYQSLSKTALDLGVTERQIQRLEKALFEIGILTWQDSGNHKRYGQRCKDTGEILYAYGVDLSPLAEMKDVLEDKLAEKQSYDRAWMEAKRKISFYRSQIRGCLAEASEQEHDKAEEWGNAYNAIAVQIRTHIKLDKLISLLDEHKALYSLIAEALSNIAVQEKTPIESSNNDIEVVHNKYIKNKKSNELESNKSVSISSNRSSNETETPKEQPTSEPEAKEIDVLRSAGLQHITLKQAVSAASDRYKNYLSLEDGEITWAEFIDAAYKLKNELNISQQNWGRGCEVLGRSGAALCVLIADQSTQRLFNPTENANAYLAAMIERALNGQLKLHNSIFGLLKKKEPQRYNI